MSTVKSGEAGFTLVEVLISLVIISIGVLGIAAIQATALSNTHSSQTESIIAIETRSLADAMLANPGFWNTSSVPTSVVMTPPSSSGGTATVSSFTGYNASANCNGTACTYSDLASYDVRNWATQFFAVIPNATRASISCNVASPPICTISAAWTQKNQTAINGGTQAAPASASTTTQTYSMVNGM